MQAAGTSRDQKGTEPSHWPGEAPRAFFASLFAMPFVIEPKQLWLHRDCNALSKTPAFEWAASSRSFSGLPVEANAKGGGEE
jgi:hypothetical protein